MDSELHFAPDVASARAPMRVAYHLAMEGLSEAITEEKRRRALQLYSEYEKVERHDSVSGVGHRGDSDDDKQMVLELGE